MRKKMVSIVGHTESTCNYIKQQLLGFLKEYIDIKIWCTSQSFVPPADFRSADIFVVSNQTVWENVRGQLPPEKRVLIAHRIINIHNLDMLLDLEPGTRSYVVGTTKETVQNTIDILHSLGLRHFELIPYYPGMASEIPADVKTAITTGLAYLAPRHVQHIIDLGGKGLDLSTFAELLQYLDVPVTILNDISHYYLKAILNNTLRVRTVSRQNETLKQRLEVILGTVDEAIVAIDQTGKITVFNPAAERMLNIQSEQIIGKAIKQVLPGIDFTACLKTGEGLRNKIKTINEQYYVVNANVITEETGMVSGVVAVFRPVQEVQELETKVRRELSKKGNIAKYTLRDIKGESPALEKAIALTKRFAQTEQTILLEGESGTGKELFAQAIHNLSPRRNGPFIAVNFAAIPDSLIESELFGYEEGAFTGAKRGGRPGLFEAAHLGTIFLDEIGSASLDVQKRLLRVLEEREVRRLGSGRITPVDVRVVAATNMSLETLVSQGLFRQDLFYRLCTLPVVIPPLRARKSDILSLVNHLTEKTMGQSLSMEQGLAAFLTNYDWPGNIRELQNVVKYLCNVLRSDETANVSHLPEYLLRKLQQMPAADDRPGAPLNSALIPERFNDPETIRVIGIILTEIRRHSVAQSGVGWQTLLKCLDGHSRATEYSVKKWLKILGELGYIEAGKTRQGNRITKRGSDLLEQIESYQRR